VYIDARHDYCSVTEDLELYWPKLRPGGIVAGHDYMLGHALKEFIPGEFSDRFDLCPNGKVNNRSVKGAVDDFAKMKGLNVALTFHDFPPFLSFLLRKPCVHSGIRGAKSEL
jgi:predicted O-methyltransferase YrrM